MQNEPHPFTYALLALILAQLRAFSASPLLRMLLLSLSLHLALIMLIQPEPGRAVATIQVINARIVQAQAELPVETALPEPVALPTSEPPTEPVNLPVPESVPAAPEMPIVPAPAQVDLSHQPVAAIPAKPSPEFAQAVSNADSNGTAPTLPAGDENLLTVPVMVDTRWYTARQLDVQPKARQAVSPVYPETARRDGITGTATLLMRIDEFGVVQDVTVEEASPEGVFDESARQAFLNARFTPARLAGRAVRSEIRIRVSYTLQD